MHLTTGRRVRTIAEPPAAGAVSGAMPRNTYEILIRRRSASNRFPIDKARSCHVPGNPERIMLDIVFVALGLGWLAISVGYAVLCDRL
jgi:hypothetical protein